jgi:NADPH2:quinone reductase
MRAIRLHRPGGPEALTLDELPVPVPGPGEALVRVEAAGVNFIDVYHRTGLYPMARPFTLGQEGAGTVDAVGSDVTELRAGDRVGWATTMGAYADYAVIPTAKLVPLPDGVAARDAAAVLLQGMTAHYLAKATYPLASGSTCVIHAAAGGVGLLLVQIAKRCGARVIGVVSTDEKGELARAAGTDLVLRYAQEDFVAAARRFAQGEGVDVVYDGVGKDTFETSLKCLRPRGMLVSYGNASGPVPPIEPLLLSRGGSLFLTRPTLAHYVATRTELTQRAADILGWVRSGALAVRIHHAYPLAAAGDAHRELESRRSAGKLLLLPG